MELNPVESLSRQFDNIEQSLSVDAEIIPLPEMNLCTSFSGSDFISLDKGQINDPFFISEIIGPLDEHISVDIAQPGITVTVII